MAKQQQGWKDVLQAAKSKGSRQDDPDNQRKKKKLAALHYKRRKLEKDVRKYIKNHKYISYRDIDELGRKNGFYFG